jgi:hypothetical protein
MEVILPKFIFVGLVFALAMFAAACGGGGKDSSPGSSGAPAATATPDVAPLLAQVRRATEKYQDVQAAVADGYIQASPCEQTASGAMGAHYLKQALFDNQIEIDKPEALLYLPEAGGRLTLIGVEYAKTDADQVLQTMDDRPTLFGRPFEGPMLGHVAGMPTHYDLHVWVWKDNPNGMFAQYNPSLRCPA